MAHGDELLNQRRQKLEALRQEGIDPFPAEVFGAPRIAEVLAGFAADQPVSAGGRLMSLRGHGKSAFADLKDGSGKIQIYLKVDITGAEAFARFSQVDIGDFLGVRGSGFITRTGEKTILVKEWKILAKSLRPLPEKWHGLTDVEARYRRRYLDLIMNEPVKETFVVRSRAVKAIRDFLDARGFLEVETPVLQPLAGGATARPFVTHHNALARDLFLRVAPELYLKRLLIGGMDRVYELGKNFRNEGISVRHNPEFTMLEFYQAYADYRQMMQLTEELLLRVAEEVKGGRELEYAGKKINLKPPWRRLTFFDALRTYTGVDFAGMKSNAEAEAAGRALGLEIEKGTGLSRVLDEVLKKKVAPALQDPTFLEDYPRELSPLAKKKRDGSELVERFQLFLAGLEVANSFSELNDPLDQRERFCRQQEMRERGDDEAQRLDEDFLFALEHGMPPAGGVGIGIDRLVMVLTDSASIRDVILFPQLRPEKTGEGAKEGE